MTTFFFAGSSATLSPCGLYRYHLTREWGDPSSRCLFVMLNPSTADASKNDPTVTRCINFAQAWGFGALDVCNLFAWRSTDPKALYLASDPTGPDNDATIRNVASDAECIVAAWGAHPAVGVRGGFVLDMLRGLAPEVLCLGQTKSGAPMHPLYRPANFQPYVIGGTP